jgi:hypothetical protein
MVATPNYYFFLENPSSFSIPIFATQYIWGKASMAQCLQLVDPSKKVKIHLIPRPGAGGPHSLLLPHVTHDSDCCVLATCSPRDAVIHLISCPG